MAVQRLHGPPTSLAELARWPDVAALEDVAHHVIGRPGNVADHVEC